MKGKIKIYSSYQEMNEDEIKYVLSISPAQRIKEAVEMIRKVYPNAKNSRKIVIKNLDEYTF